MPKVGKSKKRPKSIKMPNETEIPPNQNPLLTQNPTQNVIRTPSAFESQQIAGTSINAQIQSVRASPELAQLVQNIVNRTLTDNSKPQLVDEQITDLTNLEGLDRIPDIVKAIRDFSGERSEYIAWIKSVERIFNLYGHLRGTAKYFGFLSVIRTKIIGNANSVLTSHNTLLNWTAIKQCLNTHYADRRDIGTLDYQCLTLIQGRDSIEMFYEKVYGHLTLILNNIAGMKLDKTAENILIDSYRNKALDTFIRGVNGDLPRLLSVREPTDLPQALSLCTKLANQSYKSNYAHNNHNVYKPPQIPVQYINRQHKMAPPLPPRSWQGTQLQYRNPPQYPVAYNNPTPQFNIIQPQTYTQPQTYNHPQIYNQPQVYRQQNAPPRPLAPKPQPPPEPMEVDHSIRSQAMNYANRQFFQPRFVNKRPPQAQLSNYHPPKQTRNFHVNNYFVYMTLRNGTTQN